MCHMLRFLFCSLWQLLQNHHYHYKIITDETSLKGFCNSVSETISVSFMYLHYLHEADGPPLRPQEASVIFLCNIWSKGFHQLSLNPRSDHSKSAFLHFFFYRWHSSPQFDLSLKVRSAPFLHNKHPHAGFIPHVDMRNESPSLVLCLVNIRKSIFNADAKTICTNINHGWCL